MANISRRFAKMASPDFAMMSDRLWGSHENSALPTPSRMPATGNTATGSIMHLPIFWRSEKAFAKLNMGIGLVVSMIRLLFAPLTFGFGGERADFVRAGAGERALGEIAAGGVAQAADLRLHRGNRGDADAELIDAEADQDRHGVRVPSDATADADETLMRVCAFDGLGDEPQHGGVQRIDFGRELRMPAIHCERVLREVVGTEGKEIRLGREGPRHHGDGGHFDHDAARERREA